MVTVQSVSNNKYIANYLDLFCQKDANRTMQLTKDGGVLFRDNGEVRYGDALFVPQVKFSNGRTIVVVPKSYKKWNELFFYEKKGLFRTLKEVKLNDQERLAIETNLKIGSQRSYKDRFTQYFNKSGGFRGLSPINLPATSSKSIELTATILQDRVMHQVFYTNTSAEMCGIKDASGPATILKLNNGKTLIVAPRLLGHGWSDLSVFEKKGIFNRNWNEVMPSKEEALAIKATLIKNDGLSKIPLIGSTLAKITYNSLNYPFPTIFAKKEIYMVRG